MNKQNEIKQQQNKVLKTNNFNLLADVTSPKKIRNKWKKIF